MNAYPGEVRDLLRTVAAGEVRRGPYIEALERAFARMMGVRSAVFTPTCRAALGLAFRHAGLRPGSEVLLPAFTHRSVPEAVRAAGLVPTFADVSATDYNLDLDRAERAIGPNTAAIVATHLYGAPMDVKAARELADARGLALFEDCAHACGASFGLERVGTFGRAAGFSFAPTKHVNAFGGGVLATDDEGLAARVRAEVAAYPRLSAAKLARRVLSALLFDRVTAPGPFRRVVFPLMRLADRLGIDPAAVYHRTLRRAVLAEETAAAPTNLQARVALAQLAALDGELERRRRLLRAVHEGLDPEVRALATGPHARPAPVFLTLVPRERAPFVRALARRGVDAMTGVVDHCPRLFGAAGRFPVADEAADRSVGVAILRRMRAEDAAVVARAVNEAWREAGR